MMHYESERSYVAPDEQSDRAAGWWTGAHYATGLADSGVGDATSITSTPTGNASWADTIKSALPVLASVYQQRQLVKMNLARINANMEPLSPADFAAHYPAAHVQVGASSDAKNILMIAGLGIIALVGLRAAKVI